MGKAVMYLFIMAGLLATFQLFGFTTIIPTDGNVTTINNFAYMVQNPEKISFNSLVSNIWALMGALTITAFVIGAFVSRDVNVAIGVAMSVLYVGLGFSFLGVFLNLFNEIKIWAIVIISPIIIMYFLTIIEMIKSRD